MESVENYEDCEDCGECGECGECKENPEATEKVAEANGLYYGLYIIHLLTWKHIYHNQLYHLLIQVMNQV